MKSTPIRSFGRVFEASLGKRLGKVIGKALRCHVLCLIVLCVAVGCADEVSEPEYIVSPYTEKTIAFFEKSSSEYCPNVLKTVEIDGKRCLLKKQPKTIFIFFRHYILETVPEQLVQGIGFDTLIIAPRQKDKITRTNPAVLEKILSALGTICADTLELSNLDLDGSGGKKNSQRMARFLGRFGGKETPKLAPAITRCILSIKTLLIQHNTLPTIVWLQKRLDLSLCRINLTIRGELQLENLELVDRFGAASIEALTLEDFKKLNSLNCKLLREGPLPEELAIITTRPIYPMISEEIEHNIITKEWQLLVVPLQIWTDLMGPSNHPKHLIVEKLTVYIPQHGMFTELQNTSPPSMGDNIATVKVLKFLFYTKHELMFSPSIVPIIDWISRYCRGLEKLVIEESRGKTDFCLFLQNNYVEITTNPGLMSIEVGDFKCSGYQSNKKPILCLSLEAWDLYRSGMLADELTRTQTDLGQLPAEQQAMLMSREELGNDNKVCCVCKHMLADFKSSNPNTEMHILDSPIHPVCTACLNALIFNGRKAGTINCPSCRQEHILPLVKNKIEQNILGVFEIKREAPTLPVLSFPWTTPDAALPVI
ncbi:hypothetical protein NEDG_02243 [Nematocida displodere]|uniref:RING-type domain-containing protein n=1 Tax=Nematocida displodere TaxID=1805483 RepID=A0A177EE76_9MICR|nr:hypothetical protein NEDG_02243 [Nematocida displodere]